MPVVEAASGAGEVADGGGDLVGGDEPADRLTRLQRGALGGGIGGAVREQALTHGVSAVPGLTQLTRMPSRTWSAAIASVSACTAPLEAL